MNKEKVVELARLFGEGINEQFPNQSNKFKKEANLGFEIFSKALECDPKGDWSRLAHMEEGVIEMIECIQSSTCIERVSKKLEDNDINKKIVPHLHGWLADVCERSEEFNLWRRLKGVSFDHHP